MSNKMKGSARVAEATSVFEDMAYRLGRIAAATDIENGMICTFGQEVISERYCPFFRQGYGDQLHSHTGEDDEPADERDEGMEDNEQLDLSNTIVFIM